MTLSVEETAVKIETMEIRGAHRLAQAAAVALIQWAETHTGSIEPSLKENVDRLIATRPTAVSLRNGILETLSGIDVNDEVGAKELIIKQGKAFIARSNSALGRIAVIGSEVVGKGATIMTICNSTAAVKVIIESHRGKTLDMVYSLETRPRRQGLITVGELAKAEVPVTLIVDNAARYHLPDVDIIFTGADSILADGRVANKIGTAQLAAQAKEFGIPFYVCAETYKFHPGSVLGEVPKIEERDASEVWMGDPIEGVLVKNPGFDLTDAKNISGIITEKGIVGPEKASEISKGLLEMDTYEIFSRN